MDKNEAIRIFVRKNISFLSSQKATAQSVRRLRIDFIHKHKLKQASKFTNKDLAIEIVKEITKIKKENYEDILREVREIPFIVREVTDERIKEIINQNIGVLPSILKPEDLSKLQQEEYRKAKEEELKQKAMEQAQKELLEERKKLEKLIAETEKERKDIIKYKSEIDELPPKIEFDESDLTLPTTAATGEITWWKKIGLTGNPFASDEGLMGIPKEKYDDVVIRTNFVNSYLKKVERSPESFLGKSIAIIGEFGSGKTTLLDMICYKLGTKGILPCRVKLIKMPDSSAIISELLKQIGMQLSGLITQLSGFDKTLEYGSTDSLSKLALPLKDFKKYGGKGLVISIDGLHKGSYYIQQTMDFLQQLQNIHEFIYDSGVPCGFLLAGSFLWEKEIEAAPSLSGSISMIDVIPPLNEYDAVNAVIQRIKSFSPSGKSAPTIKRSSISAAFKAFSERETRPITFRSFLNHIRDRLVVGEYDEVGIEISSHFELVKLIKKYFKESDMGENYLAIEKEISRYPNLRDVLCDILPKIYQYSGIDERNDIFIDYKKVFHLLRVQKFIVKRRSPRKDPFVWSISPSLAIVLSGIQAKYSVAPEETLTLIFMGEKTAISKETETIYSSILKKLPEKATFLKDSWPELSLNLIEIEKIIEKIEEQIKSEKIENIDMSLLAQSSNIIISCILKAGGYNISNFSENHLMVFQKFWCSPENVDEIVELCKEKNTEDLSPSEVFGILNHHSDIINDSLNLLWQLTQGEGIARLINRKIIDEDKKAIHRARSLFINQSYKDTVDISCELLERKVRDIAYAIFRTIWGEESVKILPTDIQEKLSTIRYRGHRRAKRDAYENFFYDINRSEYSKILFQRKYRKVIFGEKLNDDKFSKMKDIWELAFSLGDREAHRDKPKYFREHATEISDVLRYLPVICEQFSEMAERYLYLQPFKYEKGNKGSIIGCYYLPSDINDGKTTKIEIYEKDAKRIMKTILSSISRYPRDALPLDGILIVEGIPLEKQIAMINAMIQKGLIAVKPLIYLEVTKKGLEILKGL